MITNYDIRQLQEILMMRRLVVYLLVLKYLGRLIKETDSLGKVITYAYDSKGNLKSKTDANGNTINYSYDSLSRLTKKTYQDGTIEVFKYDTKGNIIYAGNQYIAYNFIYDANGRLLAVADSNGRTISYLYDSLGNRTKMVTPEGNAVTYTYDSSNRLSQLRSDTGNFSFTYDSLGRRIKFTLPNGAYTTYNYDTSGRLTNLTYKTSNGSVIASFAYTHDNIGNRLSKTTPDRTISYQYDAIYRLTEALSSTPGYSSNTTGKGKGITTATQQQKEFYTYDSVGNRLTSDNNKTYAYNTGNQLISTNEASYNYDKNGNLIVKTNNEGTTTYAYDYKNRLIKVTTPNGTTAEFKYDPFGRRIEKSVTENGITTTKRYFYDNEDIIIEYDEQGNIGNQYIHGLGIDEPLALTTSQGTYYYHVDGLGSVVALTDSNQKVVQDYQYDSFGNLKDQKNRIKQPYTFAGREWDKEIGLYYYRARYYDAEVGRFIEKDPAGSSAGVNLYLYAKANPIRYADPFGLLSCDEVKKLAATNNLSGQSDEMIVCVCWKESNFNPNAQSSTSTARGLMQVTKAAAKDAGYDYDSLFDSATNIKAGSTYLKLRIQWAGGNVTKGLEGYGTGSGYATNILSCEKCLKDNPCDCQKCLKLIH